ncbi:2-hydroxyacid dehydrogenase [Nocardioides jensenii]|uniref:2-hydroxyacid dehydrogenase n=1 Tax=Nocardioides jensenii TaxID=1843 RepID=UPI00083509A4|nr:2-hydroxyacid dehydrogenase [Nocardioides jensenii]
MAGIVAVLPTEELREDVGPVDGVDVLVGDPGDRAAEVEVLVADYPTSPGGVDDVARFPNLRVVQLQSAGYDAVLGRIPDGVTLANATGVHDDATAELALGLTISALRGIPEAVRAHGTWTPMPVRRSLADSRVLILGYGSIGRAIAERMVAAKAVVTGVASRRREQPDDLVGQVHGIDEIAALLPGTHVVVNVLPHNRATQALVDDAFLSGLDDGALVVNVGRGPTVDTDAVLAHAGRLRFALDVTDPEPLPDGHPLWQSPDVLITPHMAGGTTAMPPRIAALVRDQLQRHVAGEPLRNVVT